MSTPWISLSATAPTSAGGSTSAPPRPTDLGELYVADVRFTTHFEEIAAGLAEFFRDAIVANADRVEES